MHESTKVPPGPSRCLTTRLWPWVGRRWIQYLRWPLPKCSRFSSGCLDLLWQQNLKKQKQNKNQKSNSDKVPSGVTYELARVSLRKVRVYLQVSECVIPGFINQERISKSYNELWIYSVSERHRLPTLTACARSHARSHAHIAQSHTFCVCAALKSLRLWNKERKSGTDLPMST